MNATYYYKHQGQHRHDPPKPPRCPPGDHRASLNVADLPKHRWCVTCRRWIRLFGWALTRPRS
jgi:hypothetical protein